MQEMELIFCATIGAMGIGYMYFTEYMEYLTKKLELQKPKEEPKVINTPFGPLTYEEPKQIEGPKYNDRHYS